MKTSPVGSLQEAQNQSRTILAALYQQQINPKAPSPLLDLMFVALTDDQGNLVPIPRKDELNQRTWNLLTKYAAHKPQELEAAISEALETDPQPPLASLKDKEAVREWLAELLSLVLNLLPVSAETVSNQP